MMTPIKVPEKGELLDQLKKYLEIAALVIGITFALIRGAQELLIVISPNSRYEIVMIITTVLTSFAIAVIIGIFKRRIFRYLGRLLPRLRQLVKGIPRWALLCSYTLFIILVIYFIAPRTDVWYVIRSRLARPLINLASTSRIHTFQPAINLPWHNYGQDFGEVKPWRWRGVSQDPSAFEESLGTLSSSGIRQVVWFLFCDGRASLRFDSNNLVTGLDPTFLKDYDAAVNIAWEKGIGITWILFDFKLMFPPQEKNGAQIFGHDDLVEKADGRESFYKNALIPLLRRFSYAPEILGWILINEPENALKDGYISPDAVQSFIHDAARIIRENTHRQPVSVSNADLESLIEFSSRHSDDLDFFVFHHYAPYLPPPVSHIRTLMQKGKDKPIYIGEFDITHPPLQIDNLVTWSQRLGYAGLWPWNPNANREVFDSSTPPPYAEAASISKIITGKNQETDSLYQGFESRHDSNSALLSADLRRDIDWWHGYWSATVIPKLNESISDWSAQVAREKKEYEINQRFETDKLRQIDDLNSRKQRKQRELIEANEDLARNTKAGDQAGISRSEKWVNDVATELQKLDGIYIPNENNELAIARQRMSLHSSLTNYYGYKIKWARELYQKFWEVEKTR